MQNSTFHQDMGPKNSLMTGDGTVKLAYCSLQVNSYWTALAFVIITVHSLYVTPVDMWNIR